MLTLGWLPPGLTLPSCRSSAVENDRHLDTGLSGLLAGAFSMAIGEWVSVQSARELYQRQVRTEAAEIRSVPDEEKKN
jgi:VIT1/CCC1 family predicted Fe2+/Mn2+ transporter